jgi:hypothetical protein
MDILSDSWRPPLANRLLAYRVALELDRRRGRRQRRPSYRLADVAEKLLRCAVRCQSAGDAQAREMTGWTDYELATRAGVSARQTRELYEEIGLGALVREALDGLAERGYVKVAGKSASGPYRGFAATSEGVAAVDLRPWYLRLLAFFDAPPSERSNPT